MKTILFATDLTPKTQPALAWARLFTSFYTDATLVLLHVSPVVLSPPPMAGLGEFSIGSSAVDLDLLTAEPPALAELADELRANGLTVTIQNRVGNVEDQILAAAADLQADLIVTGRSHPLDFFDQLVGTAATSVARLAPCPVLVVPEGAASGESVRLARVVMATQLQGDDRGILHKLADWLPTGATLELVRVHAENQPTIYDEHLFLDEFREEYKDHTLTVNMVEARTVTGGLFDYLDKHPTDLLVMTMRHHDFLEQLLNPSLTERVIRQATLPVLVYHSEQQ
jgi:nucleotide-binding universal stress UspA family protein